MPLVFRTLNKPKNADSLNEEWMLLENTGPNVINARWIPGSSCSRTRRSGW